MKYELYATRPGLWVEAPAVETEPLDVRTEDGALTFFIGRDPDTDIEECYETFTWRLAKAPKPEIKFV